MWVLANSKYSCFLLSEWEPLWGVIPLTFFGWICLSSKPPASGGGWGGLWRPVWGLAVPSCAALCWGHGALEETLSTYCAPAFEGNSALVYPGICIFVSLNNSSAAWAGFSGSEMFISGAFAFFCVIKKKKKKLWYPLKQSAIEIQVFPLTARKYIQDSRPILSDACSFFFLFKTGSQISFST